MDAFKTQVTKISSNINNLQKTCQRYEETAQKKASSVFSSSEDLRITSELLAIQDIFSESSEKIKSELKEMEEENEKIKANELDNSFLYETRYSHWQALTNKLCDLCTRYRTAKLKHKKNEEQQTISQYLIEYPGLSVDEIKQKIRENEEKGIDHKLGEVSLATRNVYSKAEQRNKEVTRIANEISELCILIDELHEMVKGQRGRIDKIEVHTAASVASTGRAKKSLKNALDYQIAATRIKRIILAIVSIIILALVGYFGYKLFKNNNNNGSDKKDDKPTE